MDKLQVHVEDDHHVLMQWNGREVMVYVQDGRLAVVVMAPSKDTITVHQQRTMGGPLNTGTVQCVPWDTQKIDPYASGTVQ